MAAEFPNTLQAIGVPGSGLTLLQQKQAGVADFQMYGTVNAVVRCQSVEENEFHCHSVFNPEINIEVNVLKAGNGEWLGSVYQVKNSQSVLVYQVSDAVLDGGGNKNPPKKHGCRRIIGCVEDQ